MTDAEKENYKKQISDATTKDQVESIINDFQNKNEENKESQQQEEELKSLKESALNTLNSLQYLSNEEKENYTKKISTSRLNEVMLPIVGEYPPPAWKGKYVKIKYATQLPTRNPKFAFFCNLPQYVKAPYKRFIENQLRENFDFQGCPMQIFFRQK